MKKLYIILTAAAVVAAVSCNKDVVPEVIEDSTPEQEQTQTLKNPITLTFTADALTKVSLSDENVGNNKTAVWDENDQIKIVWYANSQKDSTCATASNRNGSYATFTATVDGDADYYYAVYPETLPTKLDGEGNFKVIFKNKNTCPTSFSRAAYYAARTTKEAKSFAFHPISTIVKCQVTSADTKRLYFRSMNGELHQLYGHFPITFDEGNNLTVDSGANTSGNVTVKVENGAGYYYIPLPARGSSETTGDDGFIIQRRDNSDKSLAPAAYYSGTITQAPGKLYKISTAVESKEISDYYVATSTMGTGDGLSQANAETLDNLKANVPAFKYSSNIGGTFLLDKATIHFLGGTYTSPLSCFNTNDYGDEFSYTIIGGADNTTTTFTTTTSSTFNNDKATITLQNVTFSGCHTATDGGAVKIGGNTTVKFTDCSFIGNSASRGGAIHVPDTDNYYPTIYINQCQFINNTATNNGYAIDINTQKATNCASLCINNSYFYNEAVMSTGSNASQVVNKGKALVMNTTFSAATSKWGPFSLGNHKNHSTSSNDCLLLNNLIVNRTVGKTAVFETGGNYYATIKNSILSSFTHASATDAQKAQIVQSGVVNETPSLDGYTWDGTTSMTKLSASEIEAELLKKTENKYDYSLAKDFLDWLKSLSYDVSGTSYNAFQIDINKNSRSGHYWPGCYQND